MKGRKRHYLLVDTEGFVLKAKVHSAKEVMNYEGIKMLLKRAESWSSLASNTCGWTLATGERTRVVTG